MATKFWNELLITGPASSIAILSAELSSADEFAEYVKDKFSGTIEDVVTEFSDEIWLHFMSIHNPFTYPCIELAKRYPDLTFDLTFCQDPYVDNRLVCEGGQFTAYRSEQQGHGQVADYSDTVFWPD